MWRMVRLLLLLMMAVGIGGVDTESGGRRPEEPGGSMLALSPEVGSEVLLEKPLIQILGNGTRVFSFRVSGEMEDERPILFLADPSTASYLTIRFDRVSEGALDPRENVRLRDKLQGVDWDRLPDFQKAAWEPTPEPSRAMVWAEARQVPEPAGFEAESLCLAVAWSVIQTLDSELRPILQTTAVSVPERTAPGSCWARTKDSGRGWQVTRCQPLSENFQAGLSGQLASYTLSGSNPLANANLATQFVGFEPGQDGAGSLRFAISDRGSPESLFLGAVVVAPRCP